ncbi:hypothetical protein L1887_07057 [Cichorium endivia]|nr:hypothetical protein L1887_07057 [Cichorium endivia]
MKVKISSCNVCRGTHRAAQLLDHPFVKNIASSERLIPNPSPITNAVRSTGIRYGSEGVSALHARGPKYSDGHMPRNISCPVSHLGSPLLVPRSVQNMNGGLSPSLILSPRSISAVVTDDVKYKDPKQAVATIFPHNGYQASLVLF